MVEIRHVENLHDIIFFCWGWSDLDKISQTGAEWHVDCGDMAKLETRCRIPIWRTFGQITCQSHLPHCRVLPWANSTACHFRVKYHIAGWCYLVNSLSWFQSHMPHCRVQSPGEWSCHIAGCNNSIRQIENRFSPYFMFWFLKCSLGADERRLSYRLRYTCYYYYY